MLEKLVESLREAPVVKKGNMITLFTVSVMEYLQWIQMS